jgi:hypothetical protein
MEFTPSGDPMPVDAYMRLHYPIDDDFDERCLDDDYDPYYTLNNRSANRNGK